MNKFIITFLLIINATFAQASIWTVEPNQCLVTDAREYCETDVIFTLNIDLIEEYCVFEDDVKIGCFLPSGSPIVIKRKIDKPLVFTLVGEQGGIIAHANVDLTVLQAQRKRRRVKLPWSIF